MNYTIIDLGSNTVRLCVYEYENGTINTIINQKETAGLAGYVVKGALSPEGIAKACEVLQDFVKLGEKLTPPENIHILATASLRNISNREDAVAAIFAATQVRPKVLSGEEEALLDFIGISHRTSCQEGIVIDIGGGSTELVLFEKGAPTRLCSMPIGCLNLYRTHVKDIFPDKQEIKAIKKTVQAHLQATGLEKNCPIMIGTGGTLRASSKLSQKLFAPSGQAASLSADTISDLYHRMKQPDRALLDTMGKVVPERLQTIMPGLILLRQAIKHFGASTIHISAYGVREGYLLNMLTGVNANGT